MKRTNNILIVDDHQLFTAGLATVLDRLDKPVLIHELASAAQALTQLEKNNNFQLILVDLHMPSMSGLDFLRALRSRSIKARVCVISGTQDTKQIQAAFDAGAVGFIPKSSPVSIMIQGIQKVLSGGVFLPDYLWSSIVMHPGGPSNNETTGQRIGESPANEITSRQKEILVLIQEGKTNKQIADILSVSPSTVKFHMGRLFQTLNARTRTECVNIARQNNLI